MPRLRLLVFGLLAPTALLLHAPSIAAAQVRSGPSSGTRPAERNFQPFIDTYPRVIQPSAVSIPEPPPTYVWEGAGIGAVLLGLAGAVLVGGMCGDGGDGGCGWVAMKGAILVAPVGIVVGGVVGARIPKH